MIVIDQQWRERELPATRRQGQGHSRWKWFHGSARVEEGTRIQVSDKKK
jgi:hypothetical protein